MTSENTTHYNYKEEITRPTVIINMPEFFRAMRKKRRVRWIVGSFAAFMVLLLGALIVFEYFFGGGLIIDNSITVTVQVTPSELTDISVKIDGEELSGTPPYLILPPSGTYRSLEVDASGYKQVARDIKLQVSQVVTVELEPIVEEIMPDSQDELMLEGTF